MTIPYLRNKGNKKILMVNDNPFIMIGGEVHNSSSSSLEYMEKVWDKADELGMNSLFLPVTWELIEPVEGLFDFSLVDGLIKQARSRGKKIGMLWFGAWKNAQCYYAPSWVKTDIHRFKRAEITKGRTCNKNEYFFDIPYSTLSYLCQETKEADARAFRALMNYIKKVDKNDHTVVMAQVENETGVMGAAREHSPEADHLFDSDVPQDFVEHLRSVSQGMMPKIRQVLASGSSSGTWSQIFGSEAEEIFSAYHIANYVNEVAKAGKDEYSIPMSVNCWLDNGQKAGDYPSGGPVSKMIEVWQYCAPEIDIIAPDIYVPNFCEVCDDFTRVGNPLLIPETATHSYAGPRQVFVVGHHHAVGYAPFGFEEMGEPFTAAAAFLFGVDTKDPALKTPQDTDEYKWYSETLHNMMPLLTDKYGTNDLQAVISEKNEDSTMCFGNFGFKIIFDMSQAQMENMPTENIKDGVCLILKTAANEFYVIINRAILIPFSLDQNNPHIDIIALEDGNFKNGFWNKSRRLNGDEATLLGYDKPTMLRLKLSAYGNY